MPLYEYSAKQGPDRPETGTMRAASATDVLSRLHDRGYTPISIRERESSVPRLRRRSVSAAEITQFTRQMAGLLRAGVPMLRALATVAEQSGAGRFAYLADRLAGAIREGGTLSSALAAHPRLFPPVYVSMVRAGESAGALDEILLRLAEEREQEEERRRRVQAAVAYPLLLLAVGAVTVFVLLAFFMPRIAVLFEGWSRLPLPTRLLLAVSGWMAANRLAIVLSVALPLALLQRLARAEKGRLLLDGWILRLPLAGKFLLYTDIVRFARTLALLVKAGVTVAPALELSAATLRNRALRAEIETVRAATVQQGRSFSEGIKRGRAFPPYLATMIAVGEESGRIDETLVETALYYEREINRMSNLATALIEPLLILAVGGLVGFIVAAMLLPVFEISGAGIM